MALNTVAFALLLAPGCGEAGPSPEQADVAESVQSATVPVHRWEHVASGEGDALRLLDSGGVLRATLFCPADRPVLIVNVPSFRAIGSEERMSFGADDIVWTLVADPAGDSLRGGVSGEAPVPGYFGEALASADNVTVNYGAQNLGPHDPPPPADVNAFFAGCSD